VTQPLALQAFHDGLSGLRWWSTLEASWINVTLFEERARPALRLVADPIALTIDLDVVIEAADRLGVRVLR
jgi:hypothetical protein